MRYEIFISLHLYLCGCRPAVPSWLTLCSALLHLNSSSQRDMQLICLSWSTTTALGPPSPAVRAWCYAKAASAWAQTATSWGRGTTCCAPSPPSRLPAPRQAASTTDQSARRANRTANGWSESVWSELTATAREQPSAAWASRQAAGAAAAAPSWSQEFSAPSRIRETIGRVTYRNSGEEEANGKEWETVGLHQMGKKRCYKTTLYKTNASLICGQKLWLLFIIKHTHTTGISRSIFLKQEHAHKQI